VSVIPENDIPVAKTALEKADALLITAGAGIGVDSGLPDFRGNTGFWKAYPPIEKLGISFVEMANPYWFEKDPRLAWAFYGHRLNLYRQTEPHDGFQYLLEYAQSCPAKYFVFTSNVDGHFQKAGFSDHAICECHGSIHHMQCTGPCSDAIWENRDLTIEVDPDHFQARGELPVCPQCSSIARPNILMFGDWNWVSRRTSTQEQRLNSWLTEIRTQSKKLVIIEIGAGTAVPTVRMASEDIARIKDAVLIRINPRDTVVPQDHISIPFAAREGILKLLG
jgi:NAD-dependent SIR2 family protein deacetylase